MAKPQRGILVRTTAMIALVVALAAYGLTDPGPRRVSESDAGAGLTYSGSLAAGRFTGTGRAEFANGDVYTGEFANGRFHGHGTLTTADGRWFDGVFRDGQVVTGELSTAGAPRPRDDQ